LFERIPFIQTLALFADLSPEDCWTIISAAQQQCVWERQTLFYEGDRVQNVTMLFSGCVKLKQLTVQGDEVILRLTSSGELIGTLDLSGIGRHSSTAEAIKTSILLVWGLEKFEEYLERFATFRRNAVRLLEARLRELEERYLEVSTEEVGPRLSNELIRLSERFGQPVNGQHREIQLSQRELAQLTATTLSTVSRLLCEWERRGIVSLKRGAIQIRDLVALRQLALSE
jgi:CRP/FNR family transcriptional regulator, nitrogen oxide reductase regulator